MFDSVQFFKQRFKEHLKELNRYLRYIFNGHIAFALFFFISAFAVYYQKLLQELPDDFPAALLMGVVFGLVVSYSPIRTLLKEPDLIFLTVAEHEMRHYFRRTIVYSFIVQLYIVVLVSAALGPLYMAHYTERQGKMYLLTILVFIIFKIWNMISNWWMLKVQIKEKRYAEQTIRITLNILIFYFLIRGSILVTTVLTVIFFILYMMNHRRAEQINQLNWELLVEKDQHRMQTFYQFANMFTDVPHLKSKTHKRTWLVRYFGRTAYRNENAFTYLYRRTFIRSGDYLGMFVRLLVIGGLAIYFIPNIWLKILFAFLFIYMTIFQLMPLYHHHRTNIWIDLYPMSQASRVQAALQLFMQLAVVQVVCFSVIILIIAQWLAFLIVLLGGVVFSYIFINTYAKHKLKAKS